MIPSFMTSFFLFHYVHLFFVIVCNIFFLRRFKFQIIYFQINVFLFILLSTPHFCKLICKFFGCSIMINKRIICPIVEMDDLDSIIRDIVFECIVLFTNVNFENVVFPLLYLHVI
jgi:hypothetical protein